MLRRCALGLVFILLLVGCASDGGSVPFRGDDPPVVLKGDGLGIVSFGDSVDATLSELSGVLGAPSVDQTLGPPWPEPTSSWKTGRDLPCTQATGYKCVDYLRRVVWDRWGLAAVFSDVEGYGLNLNAHVSDPHFVVWEQWLSTTGDVFALGTGVAPGSTVGDLREAYGTDLGDTVVGCPGADLDVTELRLPDGSVHVLPGNDTTRDLPLDAAIEKTDAARKITFMWAGFHKTCRPQLPFQSPGPNEIDTSAAGPAACGWLSAAQIDLALHEERIVVSEAESEAFPEPWIIARLLDVCPNVDDGTVQDVCEEYRLATDPEEIAYREAIHGSFYALKQTRHHWQNATWIAAWMLAVEAEESDNETIETFLASACGTGRPTGQQEPETTTTLIEDTTTTATIIRPSTVFEEDTELIMSFYAEWSQAVDAGQDEIESYFAEHLYRDLPQCAPGEKTLPIYTAQRETIKRADDWTISWGPLNGVQPDGRVYEVQLAQRDSPSHVSILNGVPYVFWNCKGEASPQTWYAASVFVDEWGTMHAGSASSSGGFFGSGCSPGTESLPDGVWYGRITEATANSVAFNLYCKGPPPADGEEWWFTIIDNNPKIRDVRVGVTTQVFAIALDGGHEVLPYPSWFQTPHPTMFCPDEGCWDVVLFVNRSQVTEIIQTWSP